MIDRPVERGVFVFNTNKIKSEVFSSFGDVEVVHFSKKISRMVIRRGRMATVASPIWRRKIETMADMCDGIHSRGNPSQKFSQPGSFS